MSMAWILRAAVLLQFAFVPLIMPGDVLTTSRVVAVLVMGSTALWWFIAQDLRVRGIDRAEALDRWLDLGLAATLAVGSTLRLRAFLAGRSLWLDEAWLAIGVRDHSFAQLVTERLPYDQSAPLGFLLSARLGVLIAGTGPLAIRLVPLAAGSLLLVLAVIVSRVTFSSRLARLIYPLLVAVSPALVYYSTEFKQYSSDALLVLAALAVAKVGRRRDLPQLVPTIGFIAAIASIPGALAFASLATAILLHAYLSERWNGLVREFAKWFTAFLVWGVGAALNLAHSVFAGTDRDYMVGWWSEQGGFPPEQIGSPEHLVWYLERVVELIWMLLRPSGPIGPLANGLPVPLLVAAALFLALALRRAVLSASLTTLFIGLFGSALMLLAQVRLYPLSGRIVINLLPLVAFVLASILDEGVMRKGARKGAVRSASIVTAATLVLLAGASSVERLNSPRLDADMYAIVDLLGTEIREGDAVVVHSSNEQILDWHDPERRVPPSLIIIASYKDVTEVGSLAPIDELRPERVWVVATHRAGEALKIAEIIARSYAARATFDQNETLVTLLSRREVEFRPTGDRRLVEVVEP